LELRQRLEEGTERGTGIGLLERDPRVVHQRLVPRLEHGFDERLLGRKVATHGADSDTGAARDFLDLRAEAELGEDFLRGCEHTFPVAARVGAHGPSDEVRHRGVGGRKAVSTFRILASTGISIPFGPGTATAASVAGATGVSCMPTAPIAPADSDRRPV
jgi:hypothetical protein